MKLRKDCDAWRPDGTLCGDKVVQILVYENGAIRFVCKKHRLKQQEGYVEVIDLDNGIRK